MNQREALVTVLEKIQEEPWASERPYKQAIRALEKRSEVLRKSYERRYATIPEDIMEEPITLPGEEVIRDLRATHCRCGAKKESHVALCTSHYGALDSQLAKAPWQTDRVWYIPAYCRALRILHLGGSAD
jgi:hypothetical protein